MGFGVFGIRGFLWRGRGTLMDVDGRRQQGLPEPSRRRWMWECAVCGVELSECDSRRETKTSAGEEEERDKEGADLNR